MENKPIETKELNENMRAWSALYESKYSAPTKQEVAEVRSLYKALYHERNSWDNEKPSIRRGYNINRHYRYNAVALHISRFIGDDATYTDLMPAVRTKKKEIYMLSLEPATVTTVTSEGGVIRTISEHIRMPTNARFVIIANKWAPKGTRKNHITDALLVRFKPHIVHALTVNSKLWATSYSSDGSYPAWIDWSAFVEVVHQEGFSQFTTTFNIEIENTKHNTKEIENELKEMMI